MIKLVKQCFQCSPNLKTIIQNLKSILHFYKILVSQFQYVSVSYGKKSGIVLLKTKNKQNFKLEKTMDNSFQKMIYLQKDKQFRMILCEQ